jgi:hypothetical protein
VALFTLQELKDHLGISSTDHDTFLTQLTTRVSLMVARWCNRIAQAGTSALELNASDETEYYDGSGRPDLRVKRYPIVSVTSVHIDADRDFDAETLVDSSDYVTDNHGLIRYLPQEQTGFQTISYWPKGIQNVKVIYKGGYSTIPEDLKEGALLWAVSIFSKRASSGVVAESVGSYSITYGVSSTGLPVEARALLSPYRDFSGIAGGSK